MERLCRIMGFQKHICIEARGLASGFIVMWKERINLRCHWQTEKAICCDMMNEHGGILWSMAACFGSPYTGERIFGKILKIGWSSL